jgi:hypothetical protein
MSKTVALTESERTALEASMTDANWQTFIDMFWSPDEKYEPLENLVGDAGDLRGQPAT